MFTKLWCLLWVFSSCLLFWSLFIIMFPVCLVLPLFLSCSHWFVLVMCLVLWLMHIVKSNQVYLCQAFCLFCVWFMDCSCILFYNSATHLSGLFITKISAYLKEYLLWNSVILDGAMVLHISCFTIGESIMVNLDNLCIINQSLNHFQSLTTVSQNNTF